MPTVGVRDDPGYGRNSKILAALGWEPRVLLREGLERTIRFYREHREHYW